MKITINKHTATQMLLNDPYANWSKPAAETIVEFFREVEDLYSEQVEWDMAKIREEWTEYDSLVDWAEKEYGGQWMLKTGIKEEDSHLHDQKTIEEHIHSLGGTPVKITHGGWLVSFDQ